jgi:hypothetical protein
MSKLSSTLLALLLTLCLVVGMTGCYGVNWVTGSKDTETRAYDFTGFDRVEVSSAFKIEITRGDAYKVSVTANENLFEYIEVTKSNDTLRIRTRAFFSFHSSVFEASVTMPELRAITVSSASGGKVIGMQSVKSLDIEVSGASRLELVNVKAADIDAEVSGASRLNGSLEAENADLEASGASQIDLTGQVNSAHLVASGASSLRLPDFYILNADAVVSGASNANVTVNGRLDIEVSGASRLTYGGNPTLGRVEVSGASGLSRR